ncbi:hypothetical protein IFM46972_06795 [Aspergillus udagawae]|uniref:Uncharacterized protein n=1 Tax=Aspergillus udagawae TaxID=91492 RepID=A0A8H3NZ30_9EURO|nr:hypothetical protein IFM46972_06795 [Aspergillus udagawae]
MSISDPAVELGVAPTISAQAAMAAIPVETTGKMDDVVIYMVTTYSFLFKFLSENQDKSRQE